MLLRSALEGITTAPLVVIEDQLGCSGLPLLSQFIKKITTRYSRTDIFCFDMNTEFISGEVPSFTNRIVYHPMYKLSLRLDCAPSSSTYNHQCLHHEIDAFDYFQQSCAVCDDSCGSRAVVIDSLSHLIISNGIIKATDTLDKFISNSLTAGVQFQLVCLLHSDVHEERVVKAVEHLSSFIIRLKSADSDGLTEATVILRKMNGCVSKETVYYQVSSGAMQITETKSLPKRLGNSSTNEEQLLNAKLTFSLSLKEDEKVSRANVVLPYEKNNLKSNGGGQINYQLEPEDDFDEDDPDDDLDF